MRLGMMQPYFFPYLGYFGLIAATDRWVVFDTAQYARRSWVNRNRIMSGGKCGWKYVRAAVGKSPRETAIRDIRLADAERVRETVLNSLDEYERLRAPWFADTMSLIDDCLFAPDDRLSSMLVRSLRKVCEHLLLPFSPELFSEMDVSFGEAGPGEWALKTATMLGASEYINPPGGLCLFDPSAFERNGVRLSFLLHGLPAYSQKRGGFLPGLSIIDVLMWNGRAATRQMIDSYQIMTSEELGAQTGEQRVRHSA